ncbi:hypothetical protein C8A01DRAFT_32360 [Parachaetomium inaequale]|uniref:Uncharacterized protein n=1 Tax=Parachaetomium inaequale TaxID=2588326 RepID=A0AAN6PRT7_9PEZI|nr:hypothetical protein C8A01DRAFT_32360 [Parachaetomium inaequale]
MSRWEGKPSWEIDRSELARSNSPLETPPPVPLERTLTITGVKTIRERGGAHARWVRMMLIELVQGGCMLNLIKRAGDGNGQTVDPTLLSPEPFRIRVLQNVF